MLGRAGQGRVEQDRAELGRERQCWAGQVRARQGRVG